MKKKIMAAAFLILTSLTYASAASVNPQAGQPKVLRNIVSTDLPATLLTTIKNDYKDYWITDLHEFGKKNRQDYFITLENADQAVELKSTDGNSWEVVSTTPKE